MSIHPVVAPRPLDTGGPSGDTRRARAVAAATAGEVPTVAAAVRGIAPAGTARSVRSLLGCALLLALVPARGGEAFVTAVDAVGITVSDLERSVDFYRDVLDFTLEARREVTGEAVERLYGVFPARLQVARMRLGDEHIELMAFLAPRPRPYPVDSHSNDRWFQHVAIIVADMDRAYARLRAHRVEHASSGPQVLPAWNPDAGGIAAFYFRDPDGNPLEVLHFPPGKGDPRWQEGSGRLFLGIDHTAIVVADTDASLSYYRDTLGLRVAGTSENHGIEQERLNAVFGARLRITALRAPAGPGVELLEYLSPRDGRPMPPDTRASDLWHWQVNALADAGAAGARLRAGRHTQISPGPVVLDAGPALLVRDPDGHALMLTDPPPAGTR